MNKQSLDFNYMYFLAQSTFGFEDKGFDSFLDDLKVYFSERKDHSIDSILPARLVEKMIVSDFVNQTIINHEQNFNLTRMIKLIKASDEFKTFNKSEITSFINEYAQKNGFESIEENYHWARETQGASIQTLADDFIACFDASVSEYYNYSSYNVTRDINQIIRIVLESSAATDEMSAMKLLNEYAIKCGYKDIIDMYTYCFETQGVTPETLANSFLKSIGLDSSSKGNK